MHCSPTACRTSVQLFDRRRSFCAGNISVRQKESCKNKEIRRSWHRKRSCKPENDYERIACETTSCCKLQKFCKIRAKKRKKRKNMQEFSGVRKEVIRLGEVAFGLPEGEPESSRPTSTAKTACWRKPLPDRPRPAAPRILAVSDANPTGIRRPRKDDPIRRARIARISRGTTIRTGAPESARNDSETKDVVEQATPSVLRGGKNVNNIWVGR